MEARLGLALGEEVNILVHVSHVGHGLDTPCGAHACQANRRVDRRVREDLPIRREVDIRHCPLHRPRTDVLQHGSAAHARANALARASACGVVQADAAVLEACDGHGAVAREARDIRARGAVVEIPSRTRRQEALCEVALCRRAERSRARPQAAATGHAARGRPGSSAHGWCGRGAWVRCEGGRSSRVRATNARSATREVQATLSACARALWRWSRRRRRRHLPPCPACLRWR
mmetsp:Transcript_12860/g.54037  ORF Transcript_12860/g.54037 Transcript_12860/m.54037 type:complete len:233 (+) Transcript_12860:999-1697(+)